MFSQGRGLGTLPVEVALPTHRRIQAILDNDQPSGPPLVLDAFSAGKPVVASDVNGTRDYIQNGFNGVLVPPGDPLALADATSSLFGDPQRVDRMGKAALETAASLTADRFWHEVLDPYLGVSDT
jgi:glycosyltransferase involved in cell wall biosynthesis